MGEPFPLLPVASIASQMDAAKRSIAIPAMILCSRDSRKIKRATPGSKAEDQTAEKLPRLAPNGDGLNSVLWQDL